LCITFAYVYTQTCVLLAVGIQHLMAQHCGRLHKCPLERFTFPCYTAGSGYIYPAAVPDVSVSPFPEEASHSKCMWVLNSLKSACKTGHLAGQKDLLGRKGVLCISQCWVAKSQVSGDGELLGMINNGSSELQVKKSNFCVKKQVRHRLTRADLNQ